MRLSYVFRELYLRRRRSLAAMMALVAGIVLLGGAHVQPAQLDAGDQRSTSQMKTARVITILVLGDSVTAGYGLLQEQSFPSVLQSLLEQGGHNVSVINAGVSGDTTAEGLARLPAYLPPSVQTRPDIVVLELGANDGLQGKDPALVETNLDAILTRVQGEGAKILLIGARAMRNNSPEYSAAFSNIYVRQAAKHDATLYPFLGAGLFGQPEFIQQDGAHPNAQGAEIIAKNLYQFVVDMIGKVHN
jgi:acyl-CoA thioesterase I